MVNLLLQHDFNGDYKVEFGTILPLLCFLDFDTTQQG